MSLTTLGPTPRPTRPADRGEPRTRHLRGPHARPAGRGAPGGRPAQPASPSAGGPIQLVSDGSVTLRRVHVASGTVHLTDRALVLIMAVISAVVLAALITVVGQFLAVSDAPLVEPVSLIDAARVLAQE